MRTNSQGCDVFQLDFCGDGINWLTLSILIYGIKQIRVPLASSAAILHFKMVCLHLMFCLGS